MVGGSSHRSSRVARKRWKAGNRVKGSGPASVSTMLTKLMWFLELERRPPQRATLLLERRYERAGCGSRGPTHSGSAARGLAVPAVTRSSSAPEWGWGAVPKQAGSPCDHHTDHGDPIGPLVRVGTQTTPTTTVAATSAERRG